MLLDNPDAEQQRQRNTSVFWPAAFDLGQRHPELGGGMQQRLWRQVVQPSYPVDPTGGFDAKAQERNNTPI